MSDQDAIYESIRRGVESLDDAILSIEDAEWTAMTTDLGNRLMDLASTLDVVQDELREILNGR